MVEAAARGDLDVLFVDGSNLLEVMPDPARVEAALGNVPLRVHQDIVLTSQMFVDGDDVILLPAATRYEQEGGGTSTTTERQIAFSPQVADPPGDARSEWRIFGELAGRVVPAAADRVRVGRQRRAARRDRRPRADVRGDRGPRAGRRRGAVRRAPPVPGRALPDAERARPGSPCSTSRPRRWAPTSGTSRHGAASSSTRWCWRRPIRSPARRATPSTSTATTPACSASPTATR